MPPFNPAFAIETLLPAAQAAYLIMGVPMPPLPLPAGYTLVGPILADPQRAQPVMTVAPPDQQHVATAMVSESSIFGLVAWQAATQTALIAFRGTSTVWEWIADFDALPVPFLPDLRCGAVHVGFQLIYLHCRDSVWERLRNLGPARVLVIGHSLGAAVATLCVRDLALHLARPVPELYTFASPRVGDATFKASFDAAIPIRWQITNFFDVVPQVPTWPIYHHVGEEVLVHGGFQPLNPHYAHQLTTYLTGLRKLTAAVAA